MEIRHNIYCNENVTVSDCRSSCRVCRTLIRRQKRKWVLNICEIMLQTRVWKKIVQLQQCFSILAVSFFWRILCSESRIRIYKNNKYEPDPYDVDLSATHALDKISISMSILWKASGEILYLRSYQKWSKHGRICLSRSKLQKKINKNVKRAYFWG